MLREIKGEYSRILVVRITASTHSLCTEDPASVIPPFKKNGKKVFWYVVFLNTLKIKLQLKFECGIINWNLFSYYFCLCIGVPNEVHITIISLIQHNSNLKLRNVSAPFILHLCSKFYKTTNFRCKIAVVISVVLQ